MTTRQGVLEEVSFSVSIASVTPKEFSESYRLFLPQISKYLIRRVEESSVEDLASQIFEIAWRKRDEAPKGFELPWLYRIAGFTVANHRRKLATQSNLLLALRPQNSAPSAEEIALSDLSLSQAWAKLSPKERQAIALSSFEGLDNPSAARVLGISTNAYALRLSKAKSKLKTLLSENS